MKISNTYINYGVPSGLAEKLEQQDISATTIRNTSIKNLIDKYELSEHDSKFLKECLSRNPIEDTVLLKLLGNNAYRCCLCQGSASTSFIVHHIKEYSSSQNNSYENLAVLCPNHHDEAHKSGRLLTQKITPEILIEQKKIWEQDVRTNRKVFLNDFDHWNSDDSTLNYNKYILRKNGAENLDINISITAKTAFALRVKMEDPSQEFVIYLSIRTNLGKQKWIAFATLTGFKNIFKSEHLFRIGRSGYLHYKIYENIIERIDESGLDWEGEPTKIDQLRFRGIDERPIAFEYSFLE